MKRGTIPGMFFALSVAGCASIKPHVTGTASVQGNAIAVGSGTKEIVPEVRIVKETCRPPPALLERHKALPLIGEKRLTPAELVNLAIDDAGAYNDLNIDYTALIDFITRNCR